MAQDFSTPFPPLEEPYVEPPKKSRTVWIIVIVVLVLLCCCCLLATAGLGTWLWDNGDKLMEDLGVFVPVFSSIA